MDWDIPRYWGEDGSLHDADKDGPPDRGDIELGDSFLLHVVDNDDVDHYFWVHGGADLSDYEDWEDWIDEVVDDAGDRYGMAD